MLNCSEGAKHVFIFYVIPPCWYDKGSWNPSYGKTRTDLFLHGQYHGCWWPGDARSQGISNNDIQYVKPNKFGPRTFRIITGREILWDLVGHIEKCTPISKNIFKIFIIQINFGKLVWLCSTVPGDVLARSGAKPSPGSLMTKVWACISTGRIPKEIKRRCQVQ